MPNKNYLKGRRFEYKVIKELRSYGFFVVRQAKSAFPDIVAVQKPAKNKPHIVVIECKTTGRLSKKEKRALRNFRAIDIKPYLAYPVRDGRHVLVKLKEIF